MKLVSFKATKAEHALFTRIAQRAVRMNAEYDFVTAQMDINACHSNGMPLDLEALLAADDFNFAHDVFGIARHIDRDTGELEGFFVPRFSRK
jgi:hypothetical protein